jgi:hypothetical protein
VTKEKGPKKRQTHFVSLSLNFFFLRKQKEKKMQSRNEKERVLHDITRRIDEVREQRDQVGTRLRLREEELRPLSDALERSRDKEYREVYGKSTFPRSNWIRRQKIADLLAAVLHRERNIANIRSVYDAAESELQRLGQMAREIEDELAPLRDAFLGSEFLEPVPVDGSFRQSTIDRVGDYIDGLKQSIRDLRTNAAQDEDAEDYQRILPGARFALDVMRGFTDADARIPRFDLGINEVISFFDEDEKQLWDNLMSGKAGLY